MLDQERLALRAQALGVAALWCRDAPLRHRSFGDLGQVYDPFVYLAWIAVHTQTIRVGQQLDRVAAAPPVARREGGRVAGPVVMLSPRARRGVG